MGYADSANTGVAQGTAPTERADRPAICDKVCINQSTGEATAIRHHSDDFFQDQIDDMHSRLIADGVNATVTVGKAWAAVTMAALGGIDEAAGAGALARGALSTLQTTVLGAERLAGASATRGGVLSVESAQAALQGGRQMTQANGATVRILQNESGRFNVVVSGDRGIITTFENLKQKSLDRLARNYGWK